MRGRDAETRILNCRSPKRSSAARRTRSEGAVQTFQFATNQRSVRFFGKPDAQRNVSRMMCLLWFRPVVIVRVDVRRSVFITSSLFHRGGRPCRRAHISEFASVSVFFLSSFSRLFSQGQFLGSCSSCGRISRSFPCREDERTQGREGTRGRERTGRPAPTDGG